MTDHWLQNLLDGIVEPRRLLDHPFYVRWTRGELSREEIAGYAAQYRHFEARVPALLQAAADRADEGSLREAALRTLSDETAPGRAHLDLFDAFLDAVGGEPAPAGAAMIRMLETYDRLVSGSAREALAGLLVYERQSPEVAASKAAGLRAHYGISGSGVEFWDVHAGVDTEHSAWLEEALASAPEHAGHVAEAARAAAEAWTAFLDEREGARAAA